MYPKKFQKLIDNFAELPSIGPKMAERLVLFLFRRNRAKNQEFAQNISALQDLNTCKRCFNIAEGELCEICRNKIRDTHTICVVEEPLDIFSFERTAAYHGLYHVLGGTIFPPGNEAGLKIQELFKRIKEEKIKEVILAFNPTTEGDATALYLKRKLSTFKGLKITRLARGLATGGDIEYADEIMLAESLTNRKKLV